MLQPIGKSKSIPSLEVDYKALGMEIKAAEDKRQTRPVEPTRIAKQTSGTLYANGHNPYGMDKQNVINFLNKTEIKAEVKKSEPINEAMASKPVTHASRKLESNPLLTGKSIMRAGSGTDMDSATPTHREETSRNSIWDSGRVERLSNLLADTTGEKIAENKESRQSVLKDLENDRRNQVYKGLEDVDTRKVSTVTHTGGGETEVQGSYHAPKRNMSIFDTKSFETFANEHKTDGEKSSENKRNNMKVNESVYKGRVTSTKGIMNNLFDSLIKKEE